MVKHVEMINIKQILNLPKLHINHLQVLFKVELHVQKQNVLAIVNI